MAHQIEDVEIEEEQYDENEDEDFNPEEAAASEAGASSSSEDEADTKVVAPTRKSKKRKSEFQENGLDSGDEATINEREAKKRRRKGAKEKDEKGARDEEEDSGGEGGMIKTRGQRAAEKYERKHRKRGLREGEVTIDVESAWAELAGLPVGRQTTYLGLDAGDTMDVDDEANKENLDEAKTVSQDPDEMITIRRRIEYAGEITEVEERFPRSSKEAQQYLAANPDADGQPDNPTSETAPIQLQRPLRRPSIFEPNPSGLVKGVPPERLRPRAPSRLDATMAEQRAAEERKKKAERMTTVQKSALDWRGFVEGQSGLREELDEYGKSKRGYLERESFLGRVELARDGQARDARLKG